MLWFEVLGGMIERREWREGEKEERREGGRARKKRVAMMFRRRTFEIGG